MGQIKVKAAAVLNARPEDAYAAIADYRHGHPNIVPKENIYALCEFLAHRRARRPSQPSVTEVFPPAG